MDKLRTKEFGQFLLTNNKQVFDTAAIHDYLSNESYWAKHIPYETVASSVENSYGAAVFHGDQQIAYARIVTDYSTFGYLADVYVLSSYQGQGIGKALMAFVMEEPFIEKLRTFLLLTLDAHSLYKKFGFEMVKNPQHGMEIRRPGIYGDCENKCH